MVARIYGENVPQAYTEGLWVMNAYANSTEATRNGEVRRILGPTVLQIDKPYQRVLFNPVRDANPFFHVMEFVWMLAGSNDAEWIAQFNKQMMEYADDGILRGAYGYRWSQGDQITSALRLLTRDPGTRQCVLQMWDKAYDGPGARSSDRPCNTHIYLALTALGLEMTVCNRSNDYFWGMLGSNAVHFTMLQELMALALNVPVGPYRVFTNNLHAYTDMPDFAKKWSYRVVHDWYKYDEVTTQPLLAEGEKFEDFMADAYQMVNGNMSFGFNTEWFRGVAAPMHDAYLEKENRDHYVGLITAPDWQRACLEWCARRASVV